MKSKKEILRYKDKHISNVGKLQNINGCKLSKVYIPKV